MFPVTLGHFVPQYAAQEHITRQRPGDFQLISGGVADMGRLIMNVTDERYSRFLSGWKTLYFMTVEHAEKYADHYEDFKVGAGFHAIRYDRPVGHPDRHKTFLGHNTKPTRETEKICAEHRALEQAKGAGYDEIIGIVTVGKPRLPEREIEELVTPTLHPCIKCQRELAMHPLMRRRTLVITCKFETHPHPIEYQCHTFGQILRLHGQSGKIR
ncbi:MAG: hypothetical protein PHV42_00915 [Candidatus Pacebacteria bacterium]|nr:hypothetical protein [Candidatus Paceibacterota bacterium]